MTEELVTFETAKLAKEKGFPRPIYVENYFNKYDKRLYTNIKSGVFDSDIHLYAPTQSVLQKWLRDVHYLHVQITREDDEWGFVIHELKRNKGIKQGCYITYFKYEEALEAGLLEALKLII